MKEYNLVDYLIVGQGLVGSLLAHELIQHGRTFHIFDQNHQNASSKVAAGIVNPVTGRRVVKSWLIDDLIPFAKKTYLKLESILDGNFYYDRNVVRIFFSIKDENHWLEKTGDPLVENYVLENQNLDSFKDKIIEGVGIGEIQHSAQVDMNLFLEKSKSYFSNKRQITSELFDYQEITFDDDYVFYKNYKAKKIIFCEGQRGQNNPWFGKLPFEVAKGEVILVKIPDANFKKILKHKLFIVPLKNDIYWVGSTYDWDKKDDLPTEEAKQLLIFKLNKILTVPFELIDHQASIRPTTYDRRPFVGFHPVNTKLGIINGMGTKGASLAPYFVNQFVDLLLDNKPIHPEADINRFELK